MVVCGFVNKVCRVVVMVVCVGEYVGVLIRFVWCPMDVLGWQWMCVWG